MKEFERRTNERIEHVIDNRLNPVVRSLEAVSEKLANGINTAVAANKDNIAGMRIEFANLTGQLEHLLSDYHPKEKT